MNLSRKYKSIAFITSLTAILTFTLSCNSNKSFIPRVPVDIIVNTFSPDFQSLNGIGGTATIDGGSRGIILIRSEQNSFKAYDRHCTYQPDESCALVTIDDTKLFAEDTCCKSKFQLIDGNPVDGPATLGLQPYNTSFYGNIIHIWN